MAGTAENMDLMGPLAAILNNSSSSTDKKVGVLIDLAAGLLAREGTMRSPRALRLTAEAARSRLVAVVKATHKWMDDRSGASVSTVGIEAANG